MTILAGDFKKKKKKKEAKWRKFATKNKNKITGKRVFEDSASDVIIGGRKRGWGDGSANGTSSFVGVVSLGSLGR